MFLAHSFSISSRHSLYHVNLPRFQRSKGQMAALDPYLVQQREPLQRWPQQGQQQQQQLLLFRIQARSTEKGQEFRRYPQCLGFGPRARLPASLLGGGVEVPQPSGQGRKPIWQTRSIWRGPGGPGPLLHHGQAATQAGGEPWQVIVGDILARRGVPEGPGQQLQRQDTQETTPKMRAEQSARSPSRKHGRPPPIGPFPQRP